MASTARFTLVSTNARIDSMEVTLDRILAAVEARTPAAVVPEAPAPAPAPARTTKVLNRTNLRAFKATKAGKAYAGVSCADILEGRSPMPKGFHAPTGARKAAIQAWKAAQEA